MKRNFCNDPMTTWFHTKLSPHILKQNCAHTGKQHMFQT